MIEVRRYPITPKGIFATVQGEGALLGVPMIFVRLSGCSIGCPQCDTDYKIAERLTAEEVVERVEETKTNEDWIWITGGEPANHDIHHLAAKLSRACRHLALATSGHIDIDYSTLLHFSFLSVSPHRWSEWRVSNVVFPADTQVNIVPGLNGLRLSDMPKHAGALFRHRYVTPLAGSKESLAECLAWVRSHPDWRLGVQAHKVWGIP